MSRLFLKKISFSLLLSATLIFAVIQVPFVQKFAIESVINSSLRHQALKISLEGVHGFFPFTLSIQKITIHDDQGACAFAKNVRIRSDIKRFLTGHLTLRSIEVNDANVDRRLKFKQTKDDKRTSFAALKIIATQKALKKIRIKNVRFAPAVFGKESFLEISYGGNWNATFQKEIKFDFKQNHQKITQIRGYVEEVSEEIRFSIQGEDDTNGIFHNLLGNDFLRPNHKMTLNLRGILPEKDTHLLTIQGEARCGDDFVKLSIRHDPKKDHVIFQARARGNHQNYKFTCVADKQSTTDQILLNQLRVQWGSNNLLFPMLKMNTQNGVSILARMHQPWAYLGKILSLDVRYQNDTIEGYIKCLDQENQQNTPLVMVTFKGDANKVEGVLEHANSELSQKFKVISSDGLIKTMLVDGPSSGEITYDFNKAIIRGRLTSKKLNIQNTIFKNILLQGDYNLKHHTGEVLATLEGTDHWIQPQHTQIKIKATHDQIQWFLSTRLMKYPMTLEGSGHIDKLWENLVIKHISLERSQKKYEVMQNPVAISLGMMKLPSFSIAGQLGSFKLTKGINEAEKSILTFDLDSRNISDLMLINSDLIASGKISGTIILQHRMNNPEAKGKIQAEFLQTKSKNQKRITKKILATANVKVDQKQLQWIVHVAGNEYFNLRSTGTVGLNHYGIMPRSVIDVTIKGHGDLQPVFEVLDLKDIVVRGQVKGDVRIQGNYEKPLIHGAISVDDGLYEDIKVGTRIVDIAIRSQIHGNKIAIASLTGHDGVQRKNGAQGRIEGKGFVNFEHLSSPQVDVTLSLIKMDIANSDKFRGQATGDITLKGKIPDVHIGGDVTLDYADLFLEELDDDDPFGVVLKDLSQKKSEVPSRKFWCPMSLKLNAPKNFMIYGLGFDSEWHGAMVVNGYINEPYLVGQIEVSKGKFSVYGKKLMIKRGTITYDPEHPGVPFLFIQSVKNVHGTNVMLEIKGYANKPTITPLSFPAKPQEQVLALLLFDSDTTRLSIGQSVELANAIAKLNGSKGEDLFDRVRSAFGVDSIEIKDIQNADPSDDSKKHALSVGKDFGNFKLSVDQGANSSTSKVTLETAISSNLNLNVDAGGEQSSGVGLDWVHRY